MENHKIKIKKIKTQKIRGEIFLNSVLHTYSGKYFFRRGKYSIFFSQKNTNIGLKVFVFFNKNFTRIEGYSLEKIQELMKIYQILYKYNLCPEPHSIVACQIDFPAAKLNTITYGIKMERIKAVKRRLIPKEIKLFKHKLKKVCIQHGLVRRETVKNIMHEAVTWWADNCIIDAKRIRLLDIDPLWKIKN